MTVSGFIVGITTQKNEDHMIQKVILPHLLNSPFKNIFVETLPVGEKIINSEKAYIIDNSLINLGI